MVWRGAGQGHPAFHRTAADCGLKPMGRVCLGELAEGCGCVEEKWEIGQEVMPIPKRKSGTAGPG